MADMILKSLKPLTAEQQVWTTDQLRYLTDRGAYNDLLSPGVAALLVTGRVNAYLVHKIGATTGIEIPGDVFVSMNEMSQAHLARCVLIDAFNLRFEDNMLFHEAV